MPHVRRRRREYAFAVAVRWRQSRPRLASPDTANGAPRERQFETSIADAFVDLSEMKGSKVLSRRVLPKSYLMSSLNLPVICYRPDLVISVSRIKLPKESKELSCVIYFNARRRLIQRRREPSSRINSHARQLAAFGIARGWAYMSKVTRPSSG